MDTIYINSKTMIREAIVPQVTSFHMYTYIYRWWVFLNWSLTRLSCIPDPTRWYKKTRHFKRLDRLQELVTTMYITPDKYSQTFREIKRTSLSHSNCKLVIFVSCLNIDSLCGAKILSLLLRKELIQYQLIPVVGYTDLKLHFMKLDGDVTNVFLLGCGAMLDLELFFELNADD